MQHAHCTHIPVHIWDLPVTTYKYITHVIHTKATQQRGPVVKQWTSVPQSPIWATEVGSWRASSQNCSYAPWKSKFTHRHVRAIINETVHNINRLHNKASVYHKCIGTLCTNGQQCPTNRMSNHIPNRMTETLCLDFRRMHVWIQCKTITVF